MIQLSIRSRLMYSHGIVSVFNAAFPFLYALVP